MLATIFVTGGLDALRNPASKVPAAESVAPQIAEQIPVLSDYDTETLVRINGGVQLVAGTALAFGWFPRVAALALAGSVIPTTAAGHRFWEVDDQLQRKQQKIHFSKNLGLLGGLLLAAADTEGRPGVGWRTRHGAEHMGAAVRRTRREARLMAKAAKAEARAHLPG